jgi:hypothetical protein
MILGMSVGTFTLLHVIISLIGIVSGVVVLAAMLAGKEPRGLTAVFLCTTVLTSATGFLFHSAKIGPAHIVGVISLVILAIALVALYARHLVGVWRPTYVITATIALYLNVFVGVVQSFDKLAPLKALAPTGSEPPFKVAQLAVLALFVVLGFLAVKRFHPPLEATA